MALVLTKEDGTGKTDANSYASAADGDAYHDGHLYASAWVNAAPESKDAALVFATRLIDAEFQFYGFRVNADQALQWPREDCPDVDAAAGELIASNIVPSVVLQATCEMARELLIADRTAAPRGEGLKYENIGVNQTGFDKRDTRAVLSRVAQSLLAKLGHPIQRGNPNSKLVRA